jgi:hypothetical protein
MCFVIGPLRLHACLSSLRKTPRKSMLFPGAAKQHKEPQVPANTVVNLLCYLDSEA